MLLDKALQADLIATTKRILKLGNGDLRVTDNALICKNPNYSLCDAMLKTDTVYSIEYLLSYWGARTDHVPCFVFKNTGCAVSLCCYLRAPARLVECDHVSEFNSLRVNESLIVSPRDIERIKPSTHGVLTNCVVRRSTCGTAYNIELVAFGPENEVEYNNLLRELYNRKRLRSVEGVWDSVEVANARLQKRCHGTLDGYRRVNDDDNVIAGFGVGGSRATHEYPIGAPVPPPPPPPPFGYCDCCSLRREPLERGNRREGRGAPGYKHQRGSSSEDDAENVETRGGGALRRRPFLALNKALLAPATVFVAVGVFLFGVALYVVVRYALAT
ncbi:B50 [miniopterid betaherpesvirus 1]|uniref:B50 n=1 Tax=miniopterid betaherpesvirus 1 TaxID=3070189 RepID=I3VQ38_9BETA|nr:B50 [miniopterid betaherpesvirus 1]AFK83882.1 B50 [miniopterid betaherpesvirus 1]